MREQLNNNPRAQLAVVAVLLVAGAFLFISMTGKKSEAPEAESGVTTPAVESSLGASPEAEAGTVSGSPVEAVPPPTVKPPAEVTAAWESGATVALLFVHDGGIDDDLVRQTSATLSGLPGVTDFVVPASQIARYSSITGGAGVERVPALVVLTPKELAKGNPTASVRYGFQAPQAVVQAVIDAGYDGPTLAYHP